MMIISRSFTENVQMILLKNGLKKLNLYDHG